MISNKFVIPSTVYQTSSSYISTQVVDHITKKGAWAMIVPHNYGRYYGKVITDVAGFQAYWKTLATAFKSDSKVIFDTNNECELANPLTNFVHRRKLIEIKITQWIKLLL
jgi:hypothetical protein